MKLNVVGVGKSLLAVAICGLACLLGGCNDHVSDLDIDVVSLTQVRAVLMDKPGVARAIDTRLPEEFAAGHIPGAMNLDLAAVSENKDSIDPSLASFKTLVVYGTDAGSGVARAMTKRLMRAGHKGVKLFAGGMAEWAGAGLKIEGVGAGKPAPAAK